MPRKSYRRGHLRRAIPIVVIVVALVGLAALPAAADRPDEFSVSFSIVSVNPCTGEPHYIDFDFDISVHEHNNNFVGHIAASGTAEPGGYTMKGVHNFVENSNVVVDFFNHVFSNDEGSKYEASGRFMMNHGEVTMDRFELRCIGAPTILP